ncbi:MAG TPA: NAD-dependent epimerase/dehydratase family protein [Thermoanaerobaculia bacterium]
MKILVLGGTVFLGWHIVEAARLRGHEITTFTRGRHNPDLFSDVEKLRGDRDGGLAALRGRRWDAVIDTSGHVPRTVRDSAQLLSSAVEHYIFISTLAVYAGFPAVPGLDENAPVVSPADPTLETVRPETMGPLKALCEEAVESAVPGRALIVRAGLLAGPHDPTDRFTYWPRRVALGGEVLAPGTPEMRVQIIDARDLASWILGAVQSRRTGVYNATGPAMPLTLEQLLATCRAEARSDARFTWVDDRFLLSAGVKPRMELPLWMPGAPGAATVDCRRALAAGLFCRPLADTVRDTLDWDAARGPAATPRAGMTREREAQLLAEWRQLQAEGLVQQTEAGHPHQQHVGARASGSVH